MIRKIGIVLGGYAAVGFAIFLLRLVQNLEEGLKTSDAFSAALGSGILWPVSVVASFWG